MVKKSTKKFRDEDLYQEPLLTEMNEGGDPDAAKEEDKKSEAKSKKSEKSKKKEEEEEDDEFGDDYVEKRNFCCCFSLKCGMIFMGILLFPDFCYEIF